MATYTSNLNLYMPDSTDDFGEFREEHNDNMVKIDNAIGGGGGSGGHTIIDQSGNNMPNRTGLQFIGASVTDDSVNDKTVVTVTGGGGGVHYSTTEQVIGTWTDGKPIYRKVFFPTINVGSNTINHGIADLDECISIRGMCKYNNTGEQLPLPYVSTNSSYVIALGNVTATTYLVDVASGFSSIQDCKIIMEYTKTTD